MIEKDAIMSFLLKQKNKNNNNISLVNKTVTENDEISKTERRNSSPGSNSKQKLETETEPSGKKKKFVLTRNSMVNGNSEKGLGAKHKVKVVNFPGGTSEIILEKLDGIIKEKRDDLRVHVGTNDITNNVNLLTNVIKIFNKVSKESPSASIAFSSIINRKDKKNKQKTLIRMPV